MNNKVSIAKLITVPPGESFPVREAGDYFYIIETTGTVQIRTSISTAWQPYQVGTGKVLKHGQFSWIEIRNQTANPIRLALYLGFCRYIDKRLNVFNGAFFNGETDAPISAKMLGVSYRRVCSSGIITLADGETYVTQGGESQYQVTAFPLAGDFSDLMAVEIGGVVVDTFYRPYVKPYKTSEQITFRNISGIPQQYIFFSVLGAGAGPCPSGPPGVSPFEFMWEETGTWEAFTPGATIQRPVTLPFVPFLYVRCVNTSGAPILFEDAYTTWDTLSLTQDWSTGNTLTVSADDFDPFSPIPPGGVFTFRFNIGFASVQSGQFTVDLDGPSMLASPVLGTFICDFTFTP